MNIVQGTIVIRPRVLLLSLLLYLFRPRASINGNEVPVRWGSNPVPVPAGRYEVAAWVPYGFIKRMGYASVVVDVAPGAAVEVSWRTPWFIFVPGPIRTKQLDPRLVQGQAQPPQQYAQPQYAQPQYAQAQYPQAQYPQAQYPQAQAQAVGGAGAGWQADPSGRHQYRWWDGTSWAPDVSDGGDTSRDPL